MHLSAPWLPTARTAPPAIMDLRAVARYLAAASHASSAHHCIKFLHDARGLLDAATNGLRASPPEYRSVMPATFAVWRRTIDQMLDVAEAQAARGVPNPYLTQPLDPRSGGELFRGRDTIVRELQNILADPTQRNSIALLGPRRCGKSSLLKMLPTLLPDALPVFFDLQDNPAGSPAQLYAAIARRIAEQARSEHQMVLPVFPDPADIVAFASWLEQLDHTLGDRRLLLCIDEFERLPDLFPGDRQALLQFMGLLRATVQNRRNLRVLVAGVAPFDELDAVWSDHLINLRELRVEHLDADSALALLIRPLPDFGAIPEQVARRVIERTGCQPLLLQLYGSMLVDRINAEERSAATDDDFVKVDREVLEGGNAVNHFRNLYDTAPADAQSALRSLAGGIEVTFSTHTRRYLVRRCLITSEGRPRIPVFYDWIKVECV
jgi:energy-coupling factor transporter ATP-binding protein EcfA2